jgi:hypothetical protein
MQSYNIVVAYDPSTNTERLALEQGRTTRVSGTSAIRSQLLTEDHIAVTNTNTNRVDPCGVSPTNAVVKLMLVSSSFK